MKDDAAELKRRYDILAGTFDYRTTASDYQLRELEIDTGVSYMRDGMTVLDVGCGLGYAAAQYASRSMITMHGIDYSASMIEGARQLLAKNYPALLNRVHFKEASVTSLPYASGTFDVVTSHRCLMALLDWELQKQALKELQRVLKPRGVLVLMEGTFEGLERLNRMREAFKLEPIAPDGRERLITLKFHEQQLLDFCKAYFRTEAIKRFGMYYFLTRIVQPLLVAPAKPSYDHRLNEVAREIARLIPDYEGIGHLVAFILRKNGQR
jgi:ubiquinone/menaquinone biosynthesis C-methylase UbiE